MDKQQYIREEQVKRDNSVCVTMSVTRTSVIDTSEVIAHLLEVCDRENASIRASFHYGDKRVTVNVKGVIRDDEYEY